MFLMCPSGRLRRLPVLLLAILLNGCGTSVPKIQEFWGTSQDAGSRVAAIASQVKCELSRAIYNVRAVDRVLPEPKLAFMDDWGVQVILQLNVNEKSAINPGISITDPLSGSESFTQFLGASLSSEAQNIDKIFLFYTVKSLNDPRAAKRTCAPHPVSGNVFVYSDLDIESWLVRSLNLHEFDINDLSVGNVPDVLSHDVKFEIVSSGSATPVWKLTRISANTNNPFIMGSRDRAQELIITMGRLSKVGGGLSETATTASIASQFGASIAAHMNYNR